LTGKVLSMQEAVARLVPDPCPVLAIGGMHMHNNPMAAVFELIRSGHHIGRLLTSPSASLNADALIGAGLVDEVATSYVGFEHLGLAPCFRRAVESGTLKVLDFCEAAITHGLHAGASGIPFAPLPAGLELADVWRANPEGYRMVVDPFGETAVLAVQAMRPDVAIIHAAEADERGTVWMAGAPFTDRLMVLAAKTVIAQVERIVTTQEISHHPQGSTLPGFLVSAVVEEPAGCLPTAAHGNYGTDENAITEYLRMSRTAEGFAEWVGRRVAVPAGGRT
jgi:glutaconate CoA-transferase, subunit A